MGTHYNGQPDEVIALDAYIKLARATDTLYHRFARALKSHGLSTSQLGVLELLWHMGPMCQRAAAEKLLQSGGNVTTVVDNLEQRGLVRRERQVNDRRFITLHLTDAGRTLIGDVFPRHAADIADAMGALSPDELRQLGDLCRKLGKANAPKDD